jgi:CheY-like chemotaxis protein
MSTILLLEHEEATRQLLKEVLENDGYKVVAPAQPSVFEQLESICPDLVVLEAHMPDVEPVSTVTRLVERRPRIPVLVVSDAWREDDQPVRETADAFVTGTADGRPVRTKVRQLLNPHAI